MLVREQIYRQASINNYNTLAWTAAFATAIAILAILDTLAWTWLAAIVCIPGWLVTQKILHPKCPFCGHISLSMSRCRIGKFCEDCGESFEQELVPKK